MVTQSTRSRFNMGHLFFSHVHFTYFTLIRLFFLNLHLVFLETTKVKTTFTFILKMKNDNSAASKTLSLKCLHFPFTRLLYDTQRRLFCQPGCLRLSVSSQSCSGREEPDRGPWFAPFCPVINPDPLALGTGGRGSRPNPPHLLPSAMQFGHTKLSPIL